MALMPDATKQQIKALWIENKSGGEIATILGITRNSVMGAIHRMRSKGEELPLKAPHLPRPKTLKPRSAPVKSKIKVEQKKERSVVDMVFDFPDNHVTIMALKRNSCRYIVAQGDVIETKYCGQNISRSSYCKTHYRMCYTPARQ